MNITEVLRETAHRPWPKPKGRWKFYQEWNNALFLHWHVDKAALEEWVPKELVIHTFEGKAWISVVLFEMNNIRPRYLPAVGNLSNFSEINIRTYVRYGDKTGVYFLNIEASSKLFCVLAKIISGLPYQYANIQHRDNVYESFNKQSSFRIRTRYKIGDEVLDKSKLDLWLTERYALFQEDEKYINQFELHHLEWEINEGRVDVLEFDYPVFNSIVNGSPHLVHFSRGVKVAAWGKERFRR